MHSGLLSFFCVSLLLRTTEAPSAESYVYTSADIPPQGQINVTSDNYDYYVYATYSPSAGNPEYYKNVVINTMKAGVTSGNSVYELGNSKSDKGSLIPLKLKGYFGIQVLDNNLNTTARMPYVIYIVKVYYGYPEVYESSWVNVDSKNGKVIILNPMPVMTLSDFDTGTVSKVEAFTAPPDNLVDSRRVFSTDSTYHGNFAPLSVVVVSGPIVTVTITDDNGGYNNYNGYSFKVNTNEVFNRPMPAGSVYSVSTPGYRSSNAQYPLQYDDTFFPTSQEISYPGTTPVTVRVRGSFSDDAQLTVSIDGVPYTYYKWNTDVSITSNSTRKVDMVIVNPQSVPNFYIEITTGGGVTSTTPSAPDFDTTSNLAPQLSFSFILLTLWMALH